ncbi:hypothetical protein FDB42_12025 [Clostridium botulinum]|nr:hypothetical protein [Clostridium botulinum]
MKPMCPDCGKELLFQEVARACKSTKINKDGKLSKRTKMIVNGEDSDIVYLHCDNCDFNYNLLYKDSSEDIMEEFEEWYSENF